MTRSLVHPSLAARLSPHFFASTGTVQVAGITNTAGNPVESWSNLVGHVDLACAVSPVSATERRTDGHTYAESTHRALLAGPYPAIAAAHRFVSGGVTYDILGAETDSQGATTRMHLRVVSL